VAILRSRNVSAVTIVGNLHPQFRSFWHPVAWSDELGETPFTTRLLDIPMICVRSPSGAPVVFVDECPHRGAPLSLGCFEDGELVCGFHGWRFGLDGGATVIPSMGAGATLPARAQLSKPAAVCERHGMVWVALDEPRLPIADWPDGDDDTLGALRPTAHVSTALAAYQSENLLDASHFPFLHAALAGRNPQMTDHETLDEHSLTFRTVVRKVDDDATTTEGWLRYTAAAPFTVLLRSEEPDGALRTSFFQAIQPIDEHRTRMFFMIRVPYTDPERLAATLIVEQGILDEDHVMNSALRRTGMHVAGGPDLHVRADRNGVLYRRILRNVFDG
jgi:phenylpropionate dioxygenase-like ring-hydroxylating dioxygenase large terminal subunit